MPTKIALRNFLDINQCETFVNSFEKETIVRREITPISVGRDIHFVALVEYEE